jgi:hypothetical protein
VDTLGNEPADQELTIQEGKGVIARRPFAAPVPGVLRTRHRAVRK